MQLTVLLAGSIFLLGVMFGAILSYLIYKRHHNSTKRTQKTATTSNLDRVVKVSWTTRGKYDRSAKKVGDDSL